MDSIVSEEEHQAAYIFCPSEGGTRGAVAAPPYRTSRPSKRRRVVTADKKSGTPVLAAHGGRDQRAPPLSGLRQQHHRVADSVAFVPLLRGAESPDCVRTRAALFETAWSRADVAIQQVMREANASTLQDVCSFVTQAAEQRSKLPAAFIITGPNLSSRDLLFSQLGERLRQDPEASFVRVSSAEATNLRSVLKKIIRDVICRPQVLDTEPVEDLELAPEHTSRRRYLDYDLEALRLFLEPRGSPRVFVAFEDSEALDSSLLSDLITLFSSWRDRIHFTLFFGIGTSVELLQARLPRSTYQHLNGSQFDVSRTSDILDNVVRTCLAQADNTIVLGPDFLAAQLERQCDQVASVQVFINSIKFAYMCHFYSNPLSLFLSGSCDAEQGILLQSEHLDAVRCSRSFRDEVESALNDRGRLEYARSLLEDDEYLRSRIKEHMAYRVRWARKLSRSLNLLLDSGATSTEFVTLYLQAVTHGLNLSSRSVGVVDAIRQMSPDDLAAVIEKMVSLIGQDAAQTATSNEFGELAGVLAGSLEDLRVLQRRAGAGGRSLRSKFSAQSRVVRTTVVAQKVQLSRDTAALSDDDKSFTDLIDRITDAIVTHLACEPPHRLFLNEAWFYDFESPHRDVLVPAPGVTVEEALCQPHDYLACSCCHEPGGRASSSLPPTSILYHLYKEAGSLVNVADLWSAFSGQVAADEDGRGTEGERGDHDEPVRQLDERTALVLFYRGLAELRTMGFVQPTRKKADHIAKLRWL